MIIPSIDLMDGQAVQLVGGRERALELGDPRPLAERFGRVGEIAVVDLDAALGRGSNAPLVRELLRLARCRVGGGIRDVETAKDWLDAGAERVILGTRARPEILRELPRERVMAALDAEAGEVVVEGWRTPTGASIIERLAELQGLVSGFLVTFVELEGRMQGTDLGRARELVRHAGDAELTIAGGITSVDEVIALDRLGIDAQVGMALHTGHIGLGAVVAGLMRSDRPDGLWPTVVADELGTVLGLAWSDPRSLDEALQSGRGVYHSRERGTLQAAVAAALDQDLKLGLPKGRLQEGVLSLLGRSGFELAPQPRNYAVRAPGLDAVLLKPRSIPQLVALGFLDAGFAGRDILLDSVYENLVEVADTGLNPVRLLAAAADPTILQRPPPRPLVVATEFSTLVDRWLTDLGLAHVILHAPGSTEAYARRFADLIVDVVETGETLRANALHEVHEFARSTTVLLTRQDLAGRADLGALARTVREASS